MYSRREYVAKLLTVDYTLGLGTGLHWGKPTFPYLSTVAPYPRCGDQQHSLE
jgi:hypothetical protein